MNLTFEPCEKPDRTPPKPRKQLPRSTKPLPCSTAPIAKVNVKRTRKRQKNNAKRMRTPAYLAAKAERLLIAGNRCEYIVTAPVLDRNNKVVGERRARCIMTDELEFHEERYPKSRPIEARDGKIYCTTHHQYEEATKHPERQARRQVVARA